MGCLSQALNATNTVLSNSPNEQPLTAINRNSSHGYGLPVGGNHTYQVFEPWQRLESLLQKEGHQGEKSA